jgi:MFS family permease
MQDTNHTSGSDHQPAIQKNTPKPPLLPQKEESFYTAQFGLLCLSSFLFFSSFSMILAELPSFLTELGGKEYKGLIIALFTLAAGLSRPFSGKLTDTIGRIPIIVFGAVVCFLTGFLYPLLLTVGGFLFIRFVHGLSTGFTPTGTAAYVADVVPISKRGEAMGIFGLTNNIGTAIGPAFGSYIALHYPIEYMFYCSSGFAILSILILMKLKETLPQPQRQRFRWALLKINPRDIIELRVIAPSITLLLSVFSFGIILTVVPDFSDHLGIQNKGLFFTVFTLSSLGIRFMAGKISDRFGRVEVIKVGTLIQVLAMAVVGVATAPWVLMLGAVFFGIAVGIVSPTAFAWTIDLSKDEARGRALATLYIALEAGIGIGALMSAWVFANNPANFPWTFWLGAISAFSAFCYLQFGVKKEDMT